MKSITHPNNACGLSLQSLACKTGLSCAVLPEAFLCALYRATAPYRGCTHDCIYCDGRAEKYFVEGEFGKNIGIRESLPEQIALDIQAGIATREYGAICMGSGVTDVYQPIEEKLQITRRSLLQLLKTGLPLIILSKSSLILRDFDLFAQFPKVLLIMTITTMDHERAGILEPGASSPSQRLEVIKQAKQAGFHSGVMAMPLCPGISDYNESFDQLLRAAKQAGADFVYPGGLTLRPGCQKTYYLSHIDKEYPHLTQLYNNLYQENRLSGMPQRIAMETIQATTEQGLRDYQMPGMIPFRVYQELLSPPDSFFILLCHMQQLYKYRGINICELKKASNLFAQWLSKERRNLRHIYKKAQTNAPFIISNILTKKFEAAFFSKSDELFIDSYSNDLASILQNEKLANFCKRLFESKKDFNYINLKIEDY